MYRVLKHKKGQSLIEYVLILGLLCAIFLLLLPYIANQYQQSGQTVADEMTNQAGAVVAAVQN